MKRTSSGLILLAAAAFGLFSLAACNDSPLNSEESAESVDVLGKKPPGSPGAAGLQLGPGEVAITYSFPDVGAVQMPEGIAFDRQGNMFMSNRIGGDGTWSNWTDNRVEKLTPKGSHSILAHLGPSGDCPSGTGILGLTTDSFGNVYATVVSCLANHGVFKIMPDGSAIHLPGSEVMIFPNALTFDSDGTLYVSDSFGGAVYRMTEGGPFELWLADPLLAPDFSAAIPHGANGLAFDPPNHLYVANTVRSVIVHVPILDNGDPGTAEDITPTGPTPWLLLYPDGISIDAHGMIYAACPPAGTPPPPGIPPGPAPLSPVVKIDPGSGMVSAVVEPFFPGDPGSEYFDTQTSLAFATGPRDRKSLFVVSGDIFLTPMGSGPAVTQVGVGVPGASGQ